MTEQSSGPEYPKYPGEGSSEGGPPQPSGPAQPVGGQPSSIAKAVKLMQLGAVLSLVSVVVSLLTLDTLKNTLADAMRESDPGVSQSSIDAAYSVGVVSGVLGGVVAAGLWLWMAWKNGQGRSWARVLSTVFGALNLLFTAVGFLSPGMTTVSLAFGLVNVVLAAVILVLMWQKSSTAYYNAVSQKQMI